MTDRAASRVTRLGWAAIAAGSGAVLLIARVLTPNPLGFGTHTQLGLPPCAFYALTGLPCPTCGLTTSFAYIAHGQLTPAFAAHWLGLPLFVLVALMFPFALVACVRAWPFADIIERLRLARVAVIIAVSALLFGFARMLVWT